MPAPTPTSLPGPPRQIPRPSGRPPTGSAASLEILPALPFHAFAEPALGPFGGGLRPLLQPAAEPGRAPSPGESRQAVAEPPDAAAPRRDRPAAHAFIEVVLRLLSCDGVLCRCGHRSTSFQIDESQSRSTTQRRRWGPLPIGPDGRHRQRVGLTQAAQPSRTPHQRFAPVDLRRRSAAAGRQSTSPPSRGVRSVPIRSPIRR